MVEETFAFISLKHILQEEAKVCAQCGVKSFHSVLKKKKNNYDAAFEIWTQECGVTLRKYGQPCGQRAGFSRRCLAANAACSCDV